MPPALEVYRAMAKQLIDIGIGSPEAMDCLARSLYMRDLCAGIYAHETKTILPSASPMPDEKIVEFFESKALII